MPDGRVQRIDPDRKLVYIVRRGRTYSAPLNQVESKARVPSVRVRFDLLRHGGTESATNVQLRSGSRTNKRHRRFGDLTGARRPGAKVDTLASRAYGVDVTTQPFRVAEAWVEAMQDQDFDGATALYLPDAELHTAEDSGRGRRFIRATLERCEPPVVDDTQVEIHGVDRYVKVDCLAAPTEQADRRSTFFIIERGQIVSQWIDIDPEVDDPKTPSADGAIKSFELVCRGDIPNRARDYAEGKVRELVEREHRAARYARVKLTVAENPTVDRPAMVEATIEFEQLLVRAHCAEASFEEATDLVVKKLGAQIESHRDRQRHKPTGMVASEGTWRHGNLARTATPYFNRPEAEREIVRHKSYAADELTIDEAAWDMASLGYDFFLFVELSSGDDSLIERHDDGSLRVHHLRPGTEPDNPTVTDYVPAEGTPPKLAVSQAIELLNGSGDHLLFFRNDVSDRGNVVYRRYDGHYGLITPPAEPGTSPEEKAQTADSGGVLQDDE